MTETQARTLAVVLDRMKQQRKTKAEVARAVASAISCNKETVMRFFRNEHSVKSTVLLAVFDELGLVVQPGTSTKTATHDTAFG